MRAWGAIHHARLPIPIRVNGSKTAGHPAAIISVLPDLTTFCKARRRVGLISTTKGIGGSKRNTRNIDWSGDTARWERWDSPRVPFIIGKRFRHPAAIIAVLSHLSALCKAKGIANAANEGPQTPANLK